MLQETVVHNMYTCSFCIVLEKLGRFGKTRSMCSPNAPSCSRAALVKNGVANWQYKLAVHSADWPTPVMLPFASLELNHLRNKMTNT